MQQQDKQMKETNYTLKNCALFTHCKSKTKNKQVDNVTDLDVVIPMYNLIEYSNNYAKTLESLCQYHRYDPNGNITDSKSLKFKVRITGRNPADSNNKDIEIAVPLEYLSNISRTL